MLQAAKGVTRVNRPEDLKPALEYAMEHSISGHIIVEEFIVEGGVCGCRITSSMTDEEIEKHNVTSGGKEVRRACGAHVEIHANSQLYYIAPMCDKCNLEGKKIVIRGGTKIVPEIAPIIKK